MTKTAKVFRIETDNSDSLRDYYCSMKFRFLKLDLASQTTYTCHAAKPHSVDFNWLQNNPGQLFNNDINVYEREQMLRNERNASCEQNCWPAEDSGAVSPRVSQGGYKKTHTEVYTLPEIVDITINSDCNLSCSYCCKEYSSSWRRDLLSNGAYNISGPDARRYELTTKDQLLSRVSQFDIKCNSRYQQLMDEFILLAPNLKQIVVTGGEPLLDNYFFETLETLDLLPDAEIVIYTGLGVSRSRLERMLEKVKKFNNLCIIISAENIESHYEFNRYGNKWAEFIEKVSMIKACGVRVKFNSTITNLTVFGFADFYQYFNEDTIAVTFAFLPAMQAPYVLDDQSKNQIERAISSLPDRFKQSILQSIAGEPTNEQRINIGRFLNEYVSRRTDLTTSIFPNTFLKWVGNVV